MPGGHRKKKVVKHCGKKNKIIRPQSIKCGEDCDEKEEANEVPQPLEIGETVQEEIHTTSTETLMEETDTPIKLLQPHENKQIQVSPSSPRVGHCDKHVMEQHMQTEQLTTQVEQLTTQVQQLTMQAKQLTAEVDKYKSRCSDLEDELRALSTAKQHDQEDAQNQIRLLNQKLTASNAKLCEIRNQCQQLKQEAKLVHKALASEVGDNMCVQEIVSGTSNWRGRAQQILMLQQKISELQTQLQETNAKDSSQAENAAAKSKSAQALKQLEKERRTVQENALKQLQEKTAELEELQKKLEGIRARNRVLEGEVANLKTTAGALLEKGKHDDQLISALTIEIKRMESKVKEYQECEKVAACQWEEERQKYKKEIAQEKCKSTHMQGIITQKDEELRHLQKKLEKIREQEIFSSSCLHEETDLLPLNDLKHHIFDSSCAEDKVKPDLKHHIPDSSCGENKDAEYYQKSYLAAEGECTRLLELIAVYNKRLDEQRHKADETEDNLQRERHKSARLEAKVAQLELEKAAAFKSTYSFRTCKQSPQKPTVIPQEVQDRLELLQEQNLTLQTRLKRLKQEKCEDLKMFTKVLSNRQQNFPVKNEKILK